MNAPAKERAEIISRTIPTYQKSNGNGTKYYGCSKPYIARISKKHGNLCSLSADIFINFVRLRVFWLVHPKKSKEQKLN